MECWDGGGGPAGGCYILVRVIVNFCVTLTGLRDVGIPGKGLVSEWGFQIRLAIELVD